MTSESRIDRSEFPPNNGYPTAAELRWRQETFIAGLYSKHDPDHADKVLERLKNSTPQRERKPMPPVGTITNFRATPAVEGYN